MPTSGQLLSARTGRSCGSGGRRFRCHPEVPLSTLDVRPRPVDDGPGSRNSRIPVRHLSSVLLRTPDVFWRLIRAEATKHIFAPRDRRRLVGVSHQLSQVSLKLVNSCNLRCKTCGQSR